MRKQDIGIGQTLVCGAGAKRPQYIPDKKRWATVLVERAVTPEAPLDVSVMEKYSSRYRWTAAKNGWLVRIIDTGDPYVATGLKFLSTGGDPVQPYRGSNLRWLPADAVRNAQHIVTVSLWLEEQQAAQEIQNRKYAEKEALQKRLKAQAKLIVAAAKAAGIDLWAAPDNYDLAVHIVEDEIAKLRAVLEQAAQ